MLVVVNDNSDTTEEKIGADGEVVVELHATPKSKKKAASADEKTAIAAKPVPTKSGPSFISPTPAPSPSPIISSPPTTPTLSVPSPPPQQKKLPPPLPVMPATTPRPHKPDAHHEVVIKPPEIEDETSMPAERQRSRTIFSDAAATPNESSNLFPPPPPTNLAGGISLTNSDAPSASLSQVQSSHKGKRIFKIFVTIIGILILLGVSAFAIVWLGNDAGNPPSNVAQNGPDPLTTAKTFMSAIQQDDKTKTDELMSEHFKENVAEKNAGNTSFFDLCSPDPLCGSFIKAFDLENSSVSISDITTGDGTQLKSVRFIYTPSSSVGGVSTPNDVAVLLINENSKWLVYTLSHNVNQT